MKVDPKNQSVIEIMSWYKKVKLYKFSKEENLDFIINNEKILSWEFSDVRNDIARIGLIYLHMAANSNYQPAKDLLTWVKKDYSEQTKERDREADEHNRAVFKAEDERKERQRLQKEYDDAHPEEVKQREQIKKLESEMESLKRDKAFYETQVSRLKAQQGLV